ncbi:hypothetical protein V5799_017134 [Amblyomma americanum]|uniref:Uncharacterized protein n=1 Tax=Amblyomma americanum TaxID=6943 RepID=A0AAQ4F351_AMBAM
MILRAKGHVVNSTDSLKLTSKYSSSVRPFPVLKGPQETLPAEFVSQRSLSRQLQCLSRHPPGKSLEPSMFCLELFVFGGRPANRPRVVIILHRL